MWTVPLFVYWSQMCNDAALLPTAPSDLFSNSNLTQSCSDYTLMFSGPIAYAHESQFEPSYPLVSLKVFWSEERNDIQTASMSLQELNSKGGEYVFVADIGLVASNLSPTQAHPFVPLMNHYDYASMDSATTPLSATGLSYSDYEIWFCAFYDYVCWH